MKITPGKIVFAISVLLLLAGLWFLRSLSIIHGTLMVFYKYPLLWILPLFSLFVIYLAAGFIAWRRSQGGGWTFSQAMADISAPATFTAAIVIPMVFLLALPIAGTLTGAAIYREYKPGTLLSLPQSGETRIMPREVADVLARNGFSSPTESLENIHIVRSPDGLRWTFSQAPDGSFRKITKKAQGTAFLPADKTSRELRFASGEFEISSGHLWSDSITWKAYKKNYWTEVAESVYLPGPGGGKILVPYIGYRGLLVKTPYLAGAYLISPDGTIQDLSPEEALQNDLVRESGRLFPENLARRIQDSYKYVGGIWNRFFTHKDILQIEDGAENNTQPHYLDINNRPTWVSVAEPWGRSDAIGGIFFTDALSGQTRLWRPEENAGLTSSRKAVDATKSLAIPGISFRAGDFRAIEPRPVFRDGKVYFLVSIIPSTASTVSKSVVIDPEENKSVAIFSHNSDPGADQELSSYLAGGIIETKPENSGSQITKKQDDAAIIRDLLEQNRRTEAALEQLLEKYSK